jgi:DNA polymerase-3 subunit alpha
MELLRSQYFHDGDGITFYEKAIKYGAKFQEKMRTSSQVSLFGESSDVQIEEPIILHVRTGVQWKN